MKFPRSARHAVAILVYIVAFAIAAIGIDYGRHWDELRLVNSAADALRSGLLLPRWYNYPSVSFDLVAVSMAPEVARVAGAREPEKSRLIDELAGASLYAKPFRLRARTVFAAVALLASLWAYVWSASSGAGAWEALFAAAVVAFSWEVGYHARWIAPDAILMQFAAATMALTTLALRRVPARRVGFVTAPQSRSLQASTDARRWLDAAAIAAGLGLSTKYTGGILLLPVLIASFLVRPHRLRDPLRLVALCLGAFVATSPGVLLEPGRFLADLSYEISHYRSGHSGYTVGAGGEHARLLLEYLALELLSPWRPVALFFFALAIVGAATLVREDRAMAAVTLSLPIVYFLYMSTQRVMIVRNYLLLAPFFAVLASRGASAIAVRLPQRAPRAAWAALLAAVIVASVAWQLAAALSIGAGSAEVRGRELAAYLKEHPQRRFALSRVARAGLEKASGAASSAGAGNAGAADNLAAARAALPPNVVAEAEAQIYVFDSSEVRDWDQWIVNRPGTYELVSGPQDINFDYYPSWPGAPRLLAVSMEDARKMKVVEPNGIEPSTS